MNQNEYNKTGSSTTAEIKSILYVVMLALAIRIFVIELFFVPTGSMKQTILEGEYIFSTKYSYGYSKHSIPFSPDFFSGRILASAPERGDVVILRSSQQMEKRFIKRLIGLPGDKIQLIDDVVYINDKPIIREEVGVIDGEDGVKYRKYKETLPNGNSHFSYKFRDEKLTTKIFEVPEGHFFFLGDNRDDSDDSRANLGMVPFENFIARGRFIIFSTKALLWPEDSTITENLIGFPSRLLFWVKSIRWSRINNSLYPAN